MPLVDMHDIVAAIDRNDGAKTISLLLFQAMMFAGVASADMLYLESAGYATRKEARCHFFQKARLLYDFDYETDRVSLVQALLLMAYWYETPDDQKDSHHWMGIAISQSYIIGLHRDHNAVDAEGNFLRRRIWWSLYMRDRMIALGTRRPMQIEDTDLNVPMLTLDDFEGAMLPDGPSCIGADCKSLRDTTTQRQLAVMCIEKAKLCIRIGQVLVVQYSVPKENLSMPTEEGVTKATTMLATRPKWPDINELQACDLALFDWKANLPAETQCAAPKLCDNSIGNSSVALNGSLLHMTYYAALLTLHRPQVLRSTAAPTGFLRPDLKRSRKIISWAADEITSIAKRLHNHNLVQYLPTTGITVLVPAMVIHLLDVKAPDEATRRSSLQNLSQCMQILIRLKSIYTAADYSTAFILAAVRRVEATLPRNDTKTTDSLDLTALTNGLVEPDSGRRMQSESRTFPEHGSGSIQPSIEVQRQPGKQSIYEGTRPPSDESFTVTASDLWSHPSNEGQLFDAGISVQGGLVLDLDRWTNVGAVGETFLTEDCAFPNMNDESSEFTMDMTWMEGIKVDGSAIPF
jgi:hypothetical protein